MRVLYFHQHFSTPRGGTGTRSYEFARRLVERGHAVTIVCGSYSVADTGLRSKFVRGKRRGWVDGIDVIELELDYSNRMSFPRRTLSFLLFAFRSVALVFRERYDLVFASSTPLTAGIPGIFARRLRRKHFVFEVRDLWPDLPRQMGVIENRASLAAMEWLERLTYRTATACIGLAPGIVDGIGRAGVERRKTAMIPNGCDLNVFHPGTQTQDVTETFDAVFTGTHGLANGLDAVLDMAAVLKQRDRRDIRIKLIGDGALKPRLMSRAEQERLDNCEFCDVMPKVDLAEELRRARVGLQVLANVPGFYFATSPNKFFDYLAAGLPVVTNYPGWLAEMLAEHQCGIAVPPDEPAAFADALERLADDADLRSAMSARARSLAESRFDRRRLADQFVDFIEAAAKQ
jgi:glycosyltransferase involved in cell wall biosynthesis